MTDSSCLLTDTSSRFPLSSVFSLLQRRPEMLPDCIRICLLPHCCLLSLYEVQCAWDRQPTPVLRG